LVTVDLHYSLLTVVAGIIAVIVICSAIFLLLLIVLLVLSCVCLQRLVFEIYSKLLHTIVYIWHYQPVFGLFLVFALLARPTIVEGHTFLSLNAFWISQTVNRLPSKVYKWFRSRLKE